MLLLGCVFILFSAFWYFLVRCILFALFVRVKSHREKKNKKKKKIKTDLMTSFVLLLVWSFLVLKVSLTYSQCCLSLIFLLQNPGCLVWYLLVYFLVVHNLSSFIRLLNFLNIILIVNIF